MRKGPADLIISDACAAALPMSRLNAFARDVIKRKHFAVGYPINQNLNMKDVYKWFVDTGLCNVSMNNVGNPKKMRSSCPPSLMQRMLIKTGPVRKGAFYIF